MCSLLPKAILFYFYFKANGRCNRIFNNDVEVSIASEQANVGADFNDCIINVDLSMELCGTSARIYVQSDVTPGSITSCFLSAK